MVNLPQWAHYNSCTEGAALFPVAHKRKITSTSGAAEVFKQHKLAVTHFCSGI